MTNERTFHHIDWTAQVPTCSCGKYTLPPNIDPQSNDAVRDWMTHTHATKEF
jgi:hypothetical protein